MKEKYIKSLEIKEITIQQIFTIKFFLENRLSLVFFRKGRKSRRAFLETGPIAQALVEGTRHASTPRPFVDANGSVGSMSRHEAAG